MRKILSMMAILTVMVAVIAGCKKDPVETKLATPANIQHTFENMMLGVTWGAVDKAVSYTVELMDGSTKVDDKTVTAASAEFGPIAGGKVYKVRIRANHEKENLSSDFGEKDLDLGAEQIILDPQAGDVTKYTVKVRFPAGASVDKLEINGEEVDMTAGEIAAGIVDIADLAPGSAIKAELFLGAISRGERTYTTLKPTGEWPANAIFLAPGANLQTVIQDAENIGKTIVLPEDYVFETGTITFQGSITIVRDPDGASPEIKATGGSLFNFAANITDVSIEFEGVTIINAQANQPTNGGHVFNPNGSHGITRLSFTSCVFKNFSRGFMRMRNAGFIINELNFDDCIFEEMGSNEGNYGIVNIEEGAAVKFFNVRNSTFDRVSCIFFMHDNANSVNDSIKMENVTFYSALQRSNNNNLQFIKTNTTAAPGVSKVMLTNVILGSTGGTGTGHVEYLNTNGTLVVDNVWRTTDWKYAVESAFPTSAGVQDFAGGADDVFVSPATGDFKVKATGDISNAGDPRWR